MFNSFICADDKLYVLSGILLLGMIGYFVIELQEHNKNKLLKGGKNWLVKPLGYLHYHHYYTWSVVITICWCVSMRMSRKSWKFTIRTDCITFHTSIRSKVTIAEECIGSWWPNTHDLSCNNLGIIKRFVLYPYSFVWVRFLKGNSLFRGTKIPLSPRRAIANSCNNKSSDE